MQKQSATYVVQLLKALVTFITIFSCTKTLKNRTNVISVVKPSFQAVLSKVSKFGIFLFESLPLIAYFLLLVHHYYNHEEHPGRFQCTVCGKNFKAKQGLQVCESKHHAFPVYLCCWFSYSFIWIRIRANCATNARIVTSALGDSRLVESMNYVIKKPMNQTSSAVLSVANYSKQDKHSK